ncbi:hypothetical protein [Borrelia hispanica]|nr:hypothetical protein [Borrelia hispanica]
MKFRNKFLILSLLLIFISCKMFYSIDKETLELYDDAYIEE